MIRTSCESCGENIVEVEFLGRGPVVSSVSDTTMKSLLSNLPFGEGYVSN